MGVHHQMSVSPHFSGDDMTPLFEEVMWMIPDALVDPKEEKARFGGAQVAKDSYPDIDLVENFVDFCLFDWNFTPSRHTKIIINEDDILISDIPEKDQTVPSSDTSDNKWMVLSALMSLLFMQFYTGQKDRNSQNEMKQVTTQEIPEPMSTNQISSPSSSAKKALEI